MMWLEELEQLLRPAGGGVYVVSTGKATQLALQRRLYGADTEAQVQERFHQALEAIPKARGVILGIPSDIGAGFVRGANMGPQVIRAALLGDQEDWPDRLEAAGVVDIGDVFCVPQLLHDEMLSEQQKQASRAALYPDVTDDERAALPVSPLSIAERVLDIVLAQNPTVAPFLLGGDHSTSWPVAVSLHKARDDRWGIVQPDAHTDLLENRLGVKYCFATWSYHANEQFGRDGRLVQVGTRASGRDQQHWESTLGVRQFWAKQCLEQPAKTLDAIIAHLQERTVSGVYFSNDIDGTDDTYADATGTPEPWGLQPDWVVQLIRRLGSEVGMIGGDVMEVAPPLRSISRGVSKTTRLAARYLRETIAASLQISL